MKALICLLKPRGANLERVGIQEGITARRDWMALHRATPWSVMSLPPFAGSARSPRHHGTVWRIGAGVRAEARGA